MKGKSRISSLASFAELNPNPLCSVSLSGRVHYINPAAEKTFPDLVEKGMNHPWLAGIESELVPRLKKDEAASISRLVQLEGAWYEQRLSYSERDRRIYIYGADISALKQIEEELRRARNGLQKSVQEQSVDLGKKDRKLALEIEKRDMTRRALAEQSKIVEAFFEHSITPLVFLDRNFNFLRVNRAYTEVCMRTESELKGRNHFDLYPSNLKSKFETVVKTGEPYFVSASPLVFPERPEWGETYWNLAVIPIEGEIGEVAYIVFALENVTERLEREKNLLANSELIKHFNESSSRKEYLDAAVRTLEKFSGCACVGIRMLNEKGDIPYESYVGFGREFWKSENWLSVKRDHCACIRVITGKPLPQDRVVMSRGGSFYCGDVGEFARGLSRKDRKAYRGQCVKSGFNSVAVVPIRFGEKMYGAIHLADKAKYRLNADNIAYIESLAPLVGEGVYKSALEEEARIAQIRMAEMKRLADIGTLAATVAHELRNPLAAIRIAAYNIKRKACDPQLGSHISNIEKKVGESDQIIDNLLFYSRVRTPKKESVDLCAIVKDCAELSKRRFKDRAVKLRLKLGAIRDVILPADPLLMKELFGNVLNNAFDAIPERDGAIKLSGEMGEGAITVLVEDNGIGIERENLGKIFDPFFSTKSKGTGLGLSICSQIVNLHSGKIGIKSGKGKGTIVSITLPTSREVSG